ncbi:hypothetical protein ONZ45_g19093 [Pleurotus djamor]|nr:hypothetical protein ONZ45_g19093 [Pleurotus djamor]
MHRRLSAILSSSSSKRSDAESTIAPDGVYEGHGDDDAHSTSKGSMNTVKEKVKEKEAVPDLPPPSLKLKRLDYYYSKWSKSWKYKNTSSSVTPEARPFLGSDNDPWKEFAFVIVRTIPRQENLPPTFKVVVKSPYILQACKDVIKSWPGISWNSDPLELDPEMLLTFLPLFIAHRDSLISNPSATSDAKHIASSLSLLISTLQSDYRVTLQKIATLTSHNEITFDLLYAILIPRMTFVARCAITGEQRLFELGSVQKTAIDGKPCFLLSCESVD